MNSSDFCRLRRSLDEVARWKASEYRQFLLYAGSLVLKNRIKHSQYIHFLSLHCAIRILCTPRFCLKLNTYAKELLFYFVRNFSKLYGEEFVTHNVIISYTYPTMFSYMVRWITFRHLNLKILCLL